MNVETITGSAQTYLGVLATFIVLCLFISKEGRESNFIIDTILRVGDDFKVHLKDSVETIRREIQKLSSENKKPQDDATLSDEQIEALNKNDRDIMMITQNFVHTVTRMSAKYNPKPHFQDKEELPYIALLCLLLIITTMFVDCIGFVHIETRSLFINLLLGISSIFIVVLYHKFFQDDNVDSLDDNNIEHLVKPRSNIFVEGFFTLTFVWFILSPFICVPLISIIILCGIQILGVYIIKGKWIRLCHKYNRYNRFMVIKHYACFIVYIGALVYLINYWGDIITYFGADNHYVTNWHDTVELLKSPVFCYYFILIFFSFNTLFGPILIGFIYLKIKENEVLKQIHKHKNEVKPIITKHLDLRREIKYGLYNKS